MSKNLKRSYDVAAYIWPSYHFEPRLAHFWPEGDGEWYTVRRSTPRFEGHDMPRLPLMGCQDEADPTVMREHVELALAHGINVFIVDWYWYNNAPCLERQLNEALLPALEGTEMKFCLMWANHDVNNLWNMHEDTIHNDPKHLLWTGQTSRRDMEPMFDRLIDKYFGLDSYYKLNGHPLFSIFEQQNLIAGLGSVEATQDAMTWMRTRCCEKGLKGLELQVIAKDRQGQEKDGQIIPGSPADAAQALGFDSATSYQFCIDGGATGDYVEWAEKSMSKWAMDEKLFGTYYPHVSIGWDNTHRNPGAGREHVVTGATPDAFEACLWRAKRYLDQRPTQIPLVTINSWNEWTEGSYLLPDLRWGYRYLKAVREVFGQT